MAFAFLIACPGWLSLAGGLCESLQRLTIDRRGYLDVSGSKLS